MLWPVLAGVSSQKVADLATGACMRINFAYLGGFFERNY